MDSKDLKVYEFISSLSEEETIELLEGMGSSEHRLSDAEKLKIKTNIMDKISAAPKKKLFSGKLKIAAAILGLIVIIVAISPAGQRAFAELIKKIYYVPGAGKVTEDNGSDVYILTEPIKSKYDNMEVVVSSVEKNDKYMRIVMHGDGQSTNSKLTLSDDKGNEYVSGSSYTGVGFRWQGEYYFTDIPKDMNNFTILYSDVIRIPVKLKKAEKYEDYASIGPTDEKNNLGLTMTASRYDENVSINLIEHLSPKRQVANFGTEDKDGHTVYNMLVKDQKGRSYVVKEGAPQFGTPSNFYFTPAPDSENYSLEIPEVTLRYNVDKEISLDVSKEGETEINKNLEMNGFNITITRVIIQGDKIRLYVDNNYKKDSNENVTRFFLDFNGVINAYSWKFDENRTAEYYEFNINPGMKKVTFRFTEMYTILKGPWKFDFSVK